MPSQRVPKPSNACEDHQKASVDYMVVETPAMILILALARHRAWLDLREDNNSPRSIISESIDSNSFDIHNGSQDRKHNACGD